MSDHSYNSPPGSGTPPQHGESSRDGWILQQLNNVSRDTGTMTEAIRGLKESIDRMEAATDRNTQKIHGIQLILSGATVGVVILGAIVGIVLDKKFDQIIDLIAK